MEIKLSEKAVEAIKRVASCKRLGLQAFDMESNKGYTADILDILEELKKAL